MVKVSSTYKKIDGLRARYYKTALDKEHLLKIIAESEISEHVYNSNAIENSTLTLEETDKILHQIDCDRFISAREMFEAKNLARVVSYIEKKAKEQELNLNVMLFLHKILLSNINDDISGRFRKDNEFVRVGSHIAPSPKEVVELLEEMFAEYNSTPSLNIIKRIAKLHLVFEYIHPFCDGNGRIGRVIINYLLIREGYVPINIKFIDRKDYYQSFREFDLDNKTAIMEKIVGRALTNSYHKRLSYLEDGKIVSLSDYAKSKKLSYPNLINKAKRQTIEAFLEKGEWKISGSR
ncbi:MAG: Fic family protein [Waddliaceae bacterium]|jgi:Fic family protein|nr:Fic family protein [Waddliaceae bacterium]MBT4444813.1 Fic family protein [Waddliaceae bacterium]MBT6928488.1 Fic family protein [Waddliaceae bacterium]MBT7264359.1 Fic family protein [Waddliaceae bacterium]